MRSWWSGLVCVLAAALAGCLEASPGRIGGLAAGEIGAGAGAGAADVAGGGGGPGQSCRVTSLTVTHQGSEEAAGWPGQLPLAADGAAWFTVPSVDGAATDVLRIEVATGEGARVVASTATSALLDARDGALLLSHLPSGGAVAELRHLAPDGEVTVLHAGGSLASAAEGALMEGAPHRMVERDRAAWSAGGEVRAWRRGAEPIVLGEGAPYSWRQPWLLGDRVAWSQLQHVVVYDLATGVVALHPPGQQPVLVEGAGGAQVVYVADGGVRVAPAAGGEPQEIRAGRCGRLASDGRRVAFLCGPGEEGWLWGGGPELWVWEGAEARLVHAVDAALGSLDAPAIAGPLVSWMAYDGPAPCYPEGVARLMVTALDGGVAPVEVAAAGTPCLCCDALWPLPAVSLDGHALAWNYAAPEPAGGGGMGWARLDWTERCE